MNTFARIRTRVPTMISSATSKTEATYIQVASRREQRVSNSMDEGVSLTNYMRLPIEQYVCVDMPLAAKLERIQGNRFSLTVPPIKIFSLELLPTMYAKVLQTNSTVVIESEELILAGTRFVESLNGYFDFKARSEFTWTDRPEEKEIVSKSHVEIWADPPAPFRYFPQSLLEGTGNFVMQLAVDQVQGAFLRALGKDFEKWALSDSYRWQRSSTARLDMGGPEAPAEADSDAAQATEAQAIASPRQFLVQILLPVSPNTRILTVSLMGFILGCSIAVAVLLFRRKALPSAMEPFFVTHF